MNSYYVKLLKSSRYRKNTAWNATFDHVFKACHRDAYMQKWPFQHLQMKPKFGIEIRGMTSRRTLEWPMAKSVRPSLARMILQLPWLAAMCLSCSSTSARYLRMRTHANPFQAHFDLSSFKFKFHNCKFSNLFYFYFIGLLFHRCKNGIG